MSNYVDGFVLPIPKEHLEEYRKVAASVAEIVIEYGAISYQEFVGDDLSLEGTKSFPDAVNAQENEAVLFGWIVFESKESRDQVNEKTAADARVKELVETLTDPSKLIFDPSRMIYGGFKPLIQIEQD